MVRIKFYSEIFLLVLLVIIVNCNQQLSGVETTNGATVAIRDNCVKGETSPYASVYIFDTSYIPYIGTGLGIALVADEDGNFSLKNINKSIINVQVIDNENKQGILLTIGDDGQTYQSDLKSPGKLKGVVETTKLGKILVFIYGTGYYILAEKQGEFIFEKLPPGSYTVQASIITTDGSEMQATILSSNQKVSGIVYSDKTTIIAEKIIIP
jgi:hypothetical protein